MGCFQPLFHSYTVCLYLLPQNCLFLRFCLRRGFHHFIPYLSQFVSWWQFLATRVHNFSNCLPAFWERDHSTAFSFLHPCPGNSCFQSSEAEVALNHFVKLILRGCGDYIVPSADHSSCAIDFYSKFAGSTLQLGWRSCCARTQKEKLENSEFCSLDFVNFGANGFVACLTTNWHLNKPLINLSPTEMSLPPEVENLARCLVFYRYFCRSATNSDSQIPDGHLGLTLQFVLFEFVGPQCLA